MAKLRPKVGGNRMKKAISIGKIPMNASYHRTCAVPKKSVNE